ncbi:MAG TPA: LysM peptidoglycan-binding domain-containing protein [Geodermatophilus sp.]|jgi:LysM domain|nr:LysM peptidoglycan-binding domain-containing protein [Geodermatophilus sp.]
MADVRQAVLEFDAAVQVPWRPLLGSAATGRAAGAGRAIGRSGAAGRLAAVPSAGSALPGSGPRVAGHLRPVPDRPGGREPHAADPDASARGAGRAPTAGGASARRGQVRPGGWPVALGALPARAVRGGCAASGHPAGPRLRLTRRGRRVVTALALGGAVALGAWLAPIVGGDGTGDLRLAGGSSVVVQEGDTVWSIAGELAGSEQDVRVVVDAIEELNDLEGSVVVPGQVLELP